VVYNSTIRLRFDGRSTAYQRSLRTRWRNNALAAVTLTCLVIHLFSSAAIQAYGRNVVSSSNGYRAVELHRVGVKWRSSRSRTVVVIAALSSLGSCRHRASHSLSRLRQILPLTPGPRWHQQDGAAYRKTGFEIIGGDWVVYPKLCVHSRQNPDKYLIFCTLYLFSLRSTIFDKIVIVTVIVRVMSNSHLMRCILFPNLHLYDCACLFILQNCAHMSYTCRLTLSCLISFENN